MHTLIVIIAGFIIIGHIARKIADNYLKTINDITEWKQRNLK